MQLHFFVFKTGEVVNRAVVIIWHVNLSLL